MQVYLGNALKRRLDTGEADSGRRRCLAPSRKALLRVRPEGDTVAVVMAGLLPILVGRLHRLRGHLAASPRRWSAAW